MNAARFESPSSAEQPAIRLLNRISRGASIAVILVGSVVLIGWLLDIAVLKSVLPGLATMKPNTALCFILAGGALGARIPARHSRRWLWLGRAGAAAVALIGLLTLLEYLAGWDLAIDQLLFADTASTTFPGRPAPATALCFSALGIALLTLDSQRRYWLPSSLIFATLVIVWIALIGYIYGIAALYTIRPYGTIAIHTVLALLVLGVGMLCARPERGLVALLASTSAGGITMRRLLPAAILIPLLFGWARWEGQLNGLYDTQFGLALMVAATTITFTGLIWWTVRSIDQLDRERIRVATTLRDSEARFRALFEQAAVGIARVSLAGEWIEVNQKLCDIAGYTRAELLARRFQDITYPADLDADARQRHELIAGARQTYSLEQRYTHKLGALIWVNLTVALVREPSGRPAYFVAVIEDIAERKQAEQALERYAERLRHLRAIDQGILVGRSLAEIAEAAVMHIGHLVPSSRVAFVLVDMPAELTTIVALQVRGALQTRLGQQLPLSTLGAALEPLVAGQPYHVADTAALPEPPTALRAANAEHVRAYFYTPILAGGALIGMLNVGADAPNIFLAEHIEISREVADQLSIAIEQLRLREQVGRYAADLEQRVATRTAALAAANRELEAFSYSVSHDLRAPLRAIDGFSRILLEDYAASLADEPRRYLQLVRDSAQQMGHLIDDLLAFARLSRQPLSVRPIDHAALVRQCLAELSSEQAGRQVEIAIGELPPCTADPALLKQVWINLLSNALKYSRTRDPAVIEVGCQDGTGESIYFVKDNGVGFDMRYAGKLFDVFQRMHRAEEYEGTGVGLAIVQRIIHRHGGRVWADAQVGAGASFYFTLENAA